jgi:hypothetical protein
MDSNPSAVRSLSSYTATALSLSDEPDTDPFIDDEFPIDEDDDDLSLDGLEVENDDNPPPQYTSTALCIVSSHMQWMFEIL